METAIVALLLGVVIFLAYRLVKVLLGRTSPSAQPKRRASTDSSTLGLARVFDDSDEPELTQLSLPRLNDFGSNDDVEDEPTSAPVPVPIVFDEEADVDVATSDSAHFLVTAVGQSEQGRRKRNEDAYLVLDHPPVVAVADGIGGYRGGDVASAKVVSVIEAALQEPVTSGDTGGLPSRAYQLLKAIQTANTEVHRLGQARAELKDMGSTVVAARFSPRKERVYIAHVGDSRCYVFRAGNLHQITSDHTVGELQKAADKKADRPSQTELPTSEHLVRAIGARPAVQIDLILGKPVAGDRYLLCSDGLCRTVSTQKLTSILARRESPSATARKLVVAAEKSGATDNITVIIVDVEAAAGRAATRKEKRAKGADGRNGPSAA